MFGDCYIDEIYTGGSLTILYMFRTHDQQTKTSLSAELNVAVNGFVAGGNVSAKFSSATETAERKSELQITAFISGGRGIVNPASMEDSIRLYQNFPATVLNAGVPYRVTAKPWQEFPMPPTATWVETLVRSDTIETCGANVLNAIQYRARIQYILANPQQFVAPDIEGLTNALASLNTLIGRWGQTAKACNEDMSKCSLEGLAFPAVSWPERIAALDPIGSKRDEVLRDAEHRSARRVDGDHRSQGGNPARDARGVGAARLHHPGAEPDRPREVDAVQPNAVLQPC